MSEREQAVTITEQDIKGLTPEHRVVWKEPDAPREVELGLWEDKGGHLLTDAGVVVRWENGSMPEFIPDCIVGIIEPVFIPRRGLVIGHPEDEWDLLVCFGPDKWLTRDEFCTEWITDDDARNLIENHGWQIVDDLTKPKGGRG